MTGVAPANFPPALIAGVSPFAWDMRFSGASSKHLSPNTLWRHLKLFRWRVTVFNPAIEPYHRGWLPFLLEIDPGAQIVPVTATDERLAERKPGSVLRGPGCGYV